ncbi:MAG TPA: 4-hydroxy-tetrahydrodipicolinate reductase, partial [Xanthobacteraceae bacterium]|nr:4-hydroxy-tetrahydrodipicolinate reductase [Xanthobacteraceae bacterium]
MADLRLVIAGASGRMGRTLLRAIYEVPGFALAGAVDREGAAEIGADTGLLAGHEPSGVKVV